MGEKRILREILKGSSVPGDDLSVVARVEISTYPVEDVDPLICDLHPALLHVVRIGKGNQLIAFDTKILTRTISFFVNNKQGSKG